VLFLGPNFACNTLIVSWRQWHIDIKLPRSKCNVVFHVASWMVINFSLWLIQIPSFANQSNNCLTAIVLFGVSCQFKGLTTKLLMAFVCVFPINKSFFTMSAYLFSSSSCFIFSSFARFIFFSSSDKTLDKALDEAPSCIYRLEQ
jgi:hypothetical protein